MSRPVVLAVILLASACNVSKAPADLNTIQPWFWDNYTSGSNADIANAVNTLDAIPTVHGVNASTSFTGTLSVHLQPDDLVSVMLKGVNNPAAAQGLLAVDEMNCTLAQLEPLLYTQNQEAVHPNEYESYARTYTSSLSDFTSGHSETLAWQSTMTVTDVGAKYTDTVYGGLRLVPAQGSATPFGPILLAQTWLPKPATGTNSGSSFTQDYQMEVYYERTPGHIIHSFADWRDIDLSTDLGAFTATNSLDQSIILSNDVSWDQGIAAQCGH